MSSLEISISFHSEMISKYAKEFIPRKKRALLLRAITPKHLHWNSQMKRNLAPSQLAARKLQKTTETSTVATTNKLVAIKNETNTNKTIEPVKTESPAPKTTPTPTKRAPLNPPRKIVTPAAKPVTPAGAKKQVDNDEFSIVFEVYWAVRSRKKHKNFADGEKLSQDL